MSKGQRELFELFQPAGTWKGKGRARKQANRPAGGEPALDGDLAAAGGQAPWELASRGDAPSTPAQRSSLLTGSESVAEVVPVRIPVQVPEGQTAETAAPIPVGTVGSYAPRAELRSRPVSALRPRPRTITLRFEEAAVYGVGTVLLLVLAFLLGRYHQGQPAIVTTVHADQPASLQPNGSPLRPADITRRRQAPQPVRTQSSTPRTARTTGQTAANRARPAAQPAPRVYAILVIWYKHTPGNLRTARIWQGRLKAAGHTPVRVLEDPGKRFYYVWVGSFTGRKDPDGKKMLRRVQAMNRAFKTAELRQPPVGWASR